MSIKIINWLYFVAIWAIIAAGFTLFVGDAVRGVGIASTITLYYILQGKQREENMKHRGKRFEDEMRKWNDQPE